MCCISLLCIVYASTSHIEIIHFAYFDNCIYNILQCLYVTIINLKSGFRIIDVNICSTYIVTNNRFEINPNKVRVRGKKQRQEVTGLTVNEKVNVTPNYVKDIRNLLYIWDKYGYKSAYRSFYRKYTKHFLPKHKPVPCFVDSLRGKLNYLALVKGHYDTTYLKLKQKFDLLSSGDMENFRFDSYRNLRRFERNEGYIGIVI